MTGIAVIIPCYNLGETVGEALSSARSQTYPASEIVIIDDGSTDPGTRKVLEELKADGTIVVRTPNRGVAAARNHGIRLTSSPYIVLLDADDILEAAYLEKTASLLDRDPELGFVTCAIQAFEGASYTWTPPPCTLVGTLTRGGPHISTMFRRTLWEAVGGFDEELPGYEDTDFWVSALETGTRGAILEEPLLRYRVRENSRYRQAIEQETYVATMERIYRKHWQSVTKYAAELLQAKDVFLAELNAHRRRLEQRRGVIVYYHRIAELTPDTHGLCVSPGNFRAHMKLLREQYHPMALHDLAEAARSGSLPAGAVAVTLDDGYLTSLTTVSAILLEFDIPATFFLNTDRMNEPHEFWWDTLERVFLSGASIPPVLDFYGDGNRVYATASEGERKAAHQALFEAIYPMLPREREEALNRLAGWSGVDLSPRPTHRPMTDDEVRELAGRPGHAIGAHTVHHISLPALPPEVRRREIAVSREYLEALTGRPVRAFSYPYGEFDRQTMEIVQDAGFEYAVTVEARAVRTGIEPLLLPRLEVRDCSAAAFAELLENLRAL